MDSLTIQKYLNQLPRDKIQTARVYASDLLPASQILPSTAYVVNTMPHTHGGEHWVLIYLPPADECGGGGNIEFFDSFGRPPYLPEYQKFLRHNARRRYLFNKYRLQGFDTSFCAHYCLTYLYCRVVHRMTMNEFVQMFDISSSASIVNDELIRRLFYTFYK